MPAPTGTPSRRQTLGPVPNNASNVNRRQSVDPKKAQQRPPRVSMIPRVGRENGGPPPSPQVTAPTASSRRKTVSASDRRQSLLPPAHSSSSTSTTNSNAIRDPRPVNERAFQQQCMKSILVYLQDSGYEYPVSMKTLSNPSGKDFSNIITFLLRRVDPAFQDGTMKLEDEVALNYKGLGYPYPISKTSLVAAGSLHTWPTLLAALGWLVERLMVIAPPNRQLFSPDSEEDSTGFETLEELEKWSDKVFYYYISEAYQAFIQEDGVKTEQLEIMLSEKVERGDMFVEREIDRLTDLNATILQKMTELRGETEDLPSYMKKKEAYATDLEQFFDLLKQMEQHKAALETKVQERSKELDEVNEKLTESEERVAKVKERIATQPMSVDEMRKLDSEIKGLRESTERTIRLKESYQDNLNKTQAKLKQLCDTLEPIINNYNQTLLPLVPKISELSSDKAQLKINFYKDERMAASVQAMLGVDVSNVVKPMLESAKTVYEHKVERTSDLRQDQLDELEAATHRNTEVDNKLKILHDKAQKSQVMLQQEKSAHEAKLAVRQREVNEMESKVTALHDPASVEEQIAGYERQCAELEVSKQKYQSESIAHRDAILQSINDAISLMQKHDEYHTQKRDELREYCIAKRNETVRELLLPSNVK